MSQDYKLQTIYVLYNLQTTCSFSYFYIFTLYICRGIKLQTACSLIYFREHFDTWTIFPVGIYLCTK